MRFVSDRKASIVNKSDLFSEEYVPTDIIFRGRQIAELRFCISPLMKNEKPINAWAYGPPGSGKTSTCRFVQDQLVKETAAKGVYVNCWENNSYFAVLDKIIRSLRMLGTERLHSSFKLERLQLYLQTHRMILILDEIDQIEKRERNHLIYCFCAIRNLSLICISNYQHTIYGLDDRIKSRLNPKLIKFSPYTTEDLAKVLKQRAIHGINPDCFDDALLKTTAILSEGDARIALQTLRSAAYMAETEGAESIERKHIITSHSAVKSLKKSYLLHKLTEHHKILYDILREKGPLLSGAFWKYYKKKCVELETKSIAERTFNLYVKNMTKMGLIKFKRALVRGHVREYSIA